LHSRLQLHEAQGAATFFGIALVLFCATLFRHPEDRRWVRRLSWGVLAFVIFQGVLGGLRVVMLKLNLAIVHACIAQAFFCMATLMVIVTSKWWLAERASTEVGKPAGRALVRLAIFAWFVIYAQLILGATMRHYNAGLAIPDVPLAFGQLVPPTNLTDLRAAQARVISADDLSYLDDVSVGQVWLAYGHRIGAVIVSAVLIWLCFRVFRKHLVSGLVIPAAVLLVLLEAQVAMGVFTVIYKKPADIASIHVAVGALVLATTFVLVVRAMRVYLAVRVREVRGFEPVLPSQAALSGAINQVV
jgi:cytochrome c oxidase assembly protein subunit 15